MSRLPSGTFRLELRRVDLDHGEVRRGYRLDAADRFALVDSATLAIARDLRLPEPGGSVASVSTRSPMAYRLFTEGLRAFTQYDVFAAYRLFRAAAQEDPGFALAAYYSFRAALYADPGVADSLADRALALAAKASDRDRLLIRIHVGVHWHDPSALPLADSLAARFPDDPEALVLAATPMISATLDADRIVPLLERAIALDSAANSPPGAPCRLCDALTLLSVHYLWADSFPAAEAAARRFTRLRPGHQESWGTLAVALRFQRRIAEAEVAAARADSLTPASQRGPALDRVLRSQVMIDDYDAVNRTCAGNTRADELRIRGQARWLCTIALRNQGRYRAAHALVFAARGEEFRAPQANRDPVSEAVLDFEMGRLQLAARSWQTIAQRHAGERATGRSSSRMAWNLTLEGTARAASGDTVVLRRLADSVERIGRRSLYGRDPRLHWFLRGLLSRASGDLSAAADGFRRSVFSWTFGYTRANAELARTLLALGRPAEAIYPLQAALRGDVDGPGLYITRTELHELLGRAFDAAGQRDSAAAHVRVVARAWASPDTVFIPRRDSARAWLARWGGQAR